MFTEVLSPSSSSSRSVNVPPIEKLNLYCVLIPPPASKEVSSLKNVVVVGSGGGILLVQTLQKQINPYTHRIVVIEKRDYYADWPALIRAAVTDKDTLDERGLIPNNCAFDSNVRVIQSGANRVTDTEIIVESNEAIRYEHLVLATGSNWTGPLNLPSLKDKAIEHFKSFRGELSAAENVLIVGGGSVGLEYAGEIRHYYPEKRVTLIHGGKALLNDTYVTKFRQSLLDAMVSRGVEVVLEDKIAPEATPRDGYVVSENGRRIRTDLVIPAAGGRPNTSIMRSFDPTVITKSGTVMVSPELQVKLSSGAQNVWAIGDIIEWSEQKMVFRASSGHAPVVAKNILASIQGGKLTQYAGKPEIIFVTIGPSGGRGLVPMFGGIVIGD
ncbi:unnamed protein product [Rhizoctonia solani]|uniref:FAD/NAD(P)-binding domain-containing protein n=1 Tax=Rhizoctonia solani TaxID=456999 RepID=A0A8H2X1M9_9AGAM|nr:unnamed protein product [Rhizoctonia solani]